MRSRSSRLFIVLLHLFGVSTNQPSNSPGRSFWWNVGIVGVHPMAILFESLDLKHAGGLDGFLAQMRSMGYDPDDDILAEPYWLQDDTDGKCLGPAGFSECGDATLWLVRRRKYTPSGKKRSSDNLGDDQSNKKRQQRGLFSFICSFIGGNEQSSQGQEEWGYALQLFDAEMLSSSRTSSSENALVEIADGRQKRRRKGRRDELDEFIGKDCLIPDSAERSNKGMLDDEIGGHSSIRIGPCSSEEAWTWRVSGEGILTQDRTTLEIASLRERRKKERGRQVFMGGPIAWRLQRMGLYNRNPTPTDDSAASSGTALNDDCIWRSGSNEAILAPCEDGLETNELSIDRAPVATPSATESRASSGRVVGFSLIRYQGTASPMPKLPPLPERPILSADVNSEFLDVMPSLKDSAIRHASETQFDGSSPADHDSGLRSASPKGHSDHPPRIKRTSQSHASNPVLHPDIKPSSKLLHTSIAHGSTGNPKIQEKKKVTPLSVLRESQPTFFIDESGTPHASASKLPHASNAPKRDPNNRRLLHKPGSVPSDQTQHLLHHRHSSSLSPGSPHMHHDDAPPKLRKIPVHPYIESSKDGLWEDPATGLEFLTDLCEYLGHERKEVGRHTLVGVGQFMKTMLKIKVYGVALYLSKRDVLADPSFVPYARLNADEMRQTNDLYGHLMSSPSSNGAKIDRTLLLKLNMQLSTETMRTSLQADWKLLTEEHKGMLIQTSFKPRDADENMLRRIKSEENSSNCSCGQNAPEEFKADPSCCARGTDLVFTWRKNGDLEIRLDGRLMDSFPDPDIGSGIFYEYLRGDDPMSVDARDHFVDGLPFLLAPLAQVRGVSSPIISHGATDDVGNAKKKQTAGGFDLFRVVGDFGETVVGNVAGAVGNVGEMVSSHAEEAASNVVNTIKAVGDSARSVTSEIEKRRILIWDGMMTMPQETFKFVTSHTPILKDKFSKDSMTSLQLMRNGGSKNLHSNLSHMSTAPRGRIFRPQAGKLLGETDSLPPITDEIGVIIHPTMNFTHKLFLTMVHFYLVLLLIVSLPGPYNTRTRLVVKREKSQKESSAKLSCDNEKGLFNLPNRGSSKELLHDTVRTSVLFRIKEKEEVEDVGEWEPSFIDDTEEHFYREETRPSVIHCGTFPESTSKQPTEKMKKSLSYFL